MMSSHKNLENICYGAINKSRQILQKLGKLGYEEVYDDHVTDISTKGDMEVSHMLINYFKGLGTPMILESEESSLITIGAHPQFYITFDDIDGTANYNRGLGILPHCTVVTIFDKVDSLTYNDIVTAGIIEHNTGHYWIASKGNGIKFNGNVCNTKQDKTSLDKRTNVMLDLYMSPDISIYKELNEKTWCQDFGSSGYHYASVSNGMNHAFVNVASKGHENGAGYLLITEAGGVMTDFEGNDFGPKQYDFNRRQPAICAANESLLQELIDIMKK